MDYARWTAAGNKRADDGSRVRDHLEHAARNGSEYAIAQLRAPEFPEELAYLWDWTLELHGRSGVNMAGLNPLSYETIDAWGRLTDRQPTPTEVEGLILLDTALRSEAKAEEPEPDTPTPAPAWPTRKVNA